MRISLDVNSEELQEIIRQDLIDSYCVASSFDDEKIIDALKTVILYYSDPDQQEKFLTNIPNKES